MRFRTNASECFCGSQDLVNDRHQGHVVCNDCGTVLEEWTIREELDFNRHSAFHSENDIDADEQGSLASATMKDRIRSYVAHNRLSETLANKACLMVDKVPDKVLNKPLHAWALVVLAADALQAPLDKQLIAKAAGKPVAKLLEAVGQLKPHIAELLPQPVSGDMETLKGVRQAIAAVFHEQDKEGRAKAQKGVVRMLDAGVTKKAGLANIKAQTRANALVAHFLRCNGNLDKNASKALECSKDGVKKALRSLADVC